MASPAPSGGPELLAFLNTMETYNETNGVKAIDEEYLATVAKVLKRLSKWQLTLGDPVKDSAVENRTEWLLSKENTARWLSEKGESSNLATGSYSIPEPVASHVAVMDRKDNYVSVVTSINSWFGSKIITEGGIVMNNALANFETPTDETRGQSSSSENLALPSRRPLTMNVAALVSDVKNICGRRILSGGASPDAVGQVLYDPIFFRGDLMSSTANGRILVWNETIFVEDAFKGFPPQILENFRKRFQPGFQLLTLPYSTVNSLEKSLDVVLAVQDVRARGYEDSLENDA